LDSAAQAAVAALTTVVAESKESRGLHSMLRAGARALTAAVLLWASMRLAAWLRNKVASGFSRLAQRHAERVQPGGLKPLQSERVLVLGRMLLTGLHRLFVFIIFYNWLSFTLLSFPYMTQIGGSILRAVPGLITAHLIFFVARWFNGLLTSFFDRVRSGDIAVAWLDADVVAQPRALLLDEPFSRLDAALRIRMRALVFGMVKARGIPALLVTHDVEDMADAAALTRIAPAT
jgi:hypothetical protein